MKEITEAIVKSMLEDTFDNLSEYQVTKMMESREFLMDWGAATFGITLGGNVLNFFLNWVCNRIQRKRGKRPDWCPNK